MSLTPIDNQHFYIDDRLIDLAWINYQVKQQVNAANYHEKHRRLRWLNHFAARLTANEAVVEDEAMVKDALIALGFGWYFE